MAHEQKKAHPVAVIVGAGPGIGAAVASKFAKEGYAVALLVRTESKLKPIQKKIEEKGGVALSVPCDASDEKSVAEAFATIRSKLGDPEVLVYNASGRGPVKPQTVLEVSTEDFVNAWKISCLGALLCAKQVLPKMIEKEKGTILLTGATASWRSIGGLSSFAVGKFGLRALGQSLARENGSKGIHVAHIVVDCVVNSEQARTWMQSKYKDGVIPENTMLEPDHLAEQYWYLHQQPKSCWTHELDVRPFGETILGK